MNAFEQLIIDLTPRYGATEARSIAAILYEDAFGSKRPAEKIFSPEEETRFLALRQRLLNGEPVQYVVGQAAFLGLTLQVGPSVLVPRPETEELVLWAISLLKKRDNRRPRLLDIGTGSGCIPIVLKKNFPEAEVMATDVSPEALGTARSNAAIHGVGVQFRQNDILNRSLWADFPALDAIISNPPYIPRREEAEMPDWVKNHEPHLALFVLDEHPLIFYDMISDFALQKLRPGGLLLFECNEFSAKKVHHLLFQKGFREVEMQLDFFEKPRMVKGVK